MRTSDRAWLVLAGGVLAYEAAAPDDELLSEAADRWMLSHPWLVRTVVAAVALHLCNAAPAWCDPLHWLFVAKQRLRTR